MGVNGPGSQSPGENINEKFKSQPSQQILPKLDLFTGDAAEFVFITTKFRCCVMMAVFRTSWSVSSGRYVSTGCMLCSKDDDDITRKLLEPLLQSHTTTTGT